MTLLEAIHSRHSVRKYIDKTIEESLIGYTKMDLGIAKFRFEVGVGKKNFEWM